MEEAQGVNIIATAKREADCRASNATKGKEGKNQEGKKESRRRNQEVESRIKDK